jgi:hypothetical protein
MTTALKLLQRSLHAIPYYAEASVTQLNGQGHTHTDKPNQVATTTTNSVASSKQSGYTFYV